MSSSVEIHTSILTNFPQLKGNISAMCDISKKSIKHVTSNEKSAQNTYNKNLQDHMLVFILWLILFVIIIIIFNIF